MTLTGTPGHRYHRCGICGFMTGINEDWRKHIQKGCRPPKTKVKEMAYNPEEKFVVEKIKKQTVDTDEVTEIKEGVLEDFVTNWATFDKDGSADKKQPAIQVKTQCGSSILISLPAGKSVHPNSKLGKWIKTYGKAPHVGQVVTSTTNDKGFFNVVLQ